MTFARRYPVAFYLIAAFLITYVLGLGVFLALQAVQRSLGTDIAGINDAVLRFGPSLAGILTIGLISGRQGLRDLFLRCIRWRFAAWLYVAAILIQPVILIVALFLRGYGPAVQSLNVASVAGVFLAQVPLNVLHGGGLGEELGWRGFMLPHLTRRFSPLVASLWVAVAWFAWHVPAYLFLDKGDSDPILPFALIIAAFSIVFTWAYFHSKQSLLLVVLLHGAINAAFYTLVDLLPGVTSAAGFQPTFDWIVAGLWAVLAAIVMLVWRDGWKKTPETQA